MRSNLLNAWIEALRSGKYKQGEGQFTKIKLVKSDEVNTTFEAGVITTTKTTTEERFDCCLGVLSHIVKTDERFKDDPLYMPIHATSGSTGSFSERCLVPLHFGENLADAARIQEALVTLNDNKSEGSFNVIADVIGVTIKRDDDNWTPEGDQLTAI